MQEQISIFEGEVPLKIHNKIRLIELFAGIGAQAKALERLQERGKLPHGFEHHVVCEIDKYACKSYSAVHGVDVAPSDITKIHAKDLRIEDTDKYTYILTYSFPCQDLSLAGKQAGMVKGSGTRSGLLWEVERLLTECLALNGELPQILLMENVPQVHGKKNEKDFSKWIDFLTSLGYCSKYADLNAKNYGIPQNRNRTFMLSWLGNFSYQFPKPFELKLRLKDMLDDQVEEKYYLKDEIVQKMLDQMGNPENP